MSDVDKRSFLPNGDRTEHVLRESGMTGSVWPYCLNCNYAPGWNMTAGPVRTLSVDADPKCPGTGRTVSP